MVIPLSTGAILALRSTDYDDSYLADDADYDGDNDEDGDHYDDDNEYDYCYYTALGGRMTVRPCHLCVGR